MNIKEDEAKKGSIISKISLRTRVEVVVFAVYVALLLMFVAAHGGFSH